MPDILRNAVILNVDDEPAGRYATTRTLQQVGCRVLEAATGAKALELVASEPVDLVLLDVNLPDMLGFEVAEQLKADPATAAIPILYFSATSVDADSIVRGLEGGAEGYLTEPLAPEVLVSTVRALLRMRRASQEADERAGELEQALTQLQTAHEELEVTNEELAVANEELRTSHDGLAQQQALLQSIIDGTPGLVFVKDQKGRFLIINAQFEKLLGLSRDELRGKTDYDVFPPLAAAHYQEHDRRVLETRVPEQMEEEANLADGHHTFLASRFPLYNLRGEAYAVAAISMDVTERKQAEQERESLLHELGDQRTLLETIIDSTRSAILYLDADLTIRVANRSFVEQARMPREALVGRNYRELFARPQTEAVFRQVLETKRPVDRSEMPYVFPNQPERGVLYLDWRLVPLLDEHGEVEGLVSTTLDVTDRVRERQRIEEQERFLAAFLDNAPSAMAYLDTDLRFVRANRAYTEWMALSAGQLVGRTHPEITGIEEPAETMRRVVATGEPERRQEMPVKFAQWTERPERYIDYAVFPVKNEEGQVVGLVLSLDDATDRVLQREQLLAAERARAELAESLNREIAHRTKNNLAMAAGLLQLQVYQQRDPEVGTVLSETMARLMTFASIQEEMQTTTSAGWVDLLPVLRRVGSASAGAFAGGEAVVSVTGESVVLPSKAATNLAIVANELITNAIKHGAPGPGMKLRIDVSLERADGERSLRLCVWNSGNPVPEGFDPTQQRGMGLQLVADLAARQYGGTFILRPEGDGTLAEVLVPLEAVRRA